MQVQTWLALNSASCAFAHESAHLSVKMMQSCATQTAPEALVMSGALLGFLGPLSRTRACAFNLSLENCTVTVSVCEGAFDLLNCTVEDMLVG